MKSRVISTAFILILIMITGCAQKGTVVATAGNKVFTMKDIDERISKLPAEYQQIANQKKKEILDTMIVEYLLTGEAKRRGLNRDKEVIKLVEAANNKILIARLVDVQTAKAFVTNDEISEFYQRNKEQFVAPEMWRASHIIVDTKADADRALQRIRSGESFEDVAKDMSKDATKEKGGDIGYFAKGQLLPEFEEACIALQVNEVSNPVKSPLGYHIIKLTEHSMQRELTIDEIKPRIEVELLAIKKKESFDKLISDLKQKSRVQIKEELLVVPAQEPAAEKNEAQEMTSETK